VPRCSSQSGSVGAGHAAVPRPLPIQRSAQGRPWLSWRVALTLGALAACSTRADAQLLSPKRALTTGPAPGCEISTVAPTAVARRDNVESRRLAAVGQEAALIGDQTAARDAYAKAAALNPADERVAYDLGRAHEELDETPKAVSEFCRYLTLSPGGREAADVRTRLLRLVPAPEIKRAQDLQVAFQLGLGLFDDGNYSAAARAFDDVVRSAPTASEAVYNRGLARAASGNRTDAVKDLELFRAAAPTVDDRVAVGRAIETLRRPVYNPGVAFAAGLLPGFGQFATGRPIGGFVVLLATAGSAGASFMQRTTETTVSYVDPNGVAAPYTRSATERPYLVPGLAAAGAVSLVAMIEAVVHANRSQRYASIVAKRGAAAPAATPPSPGFAVTPLIDRNGRTGLLFSKRF
jgi:Tetratricopeptide repeat